METPSTELKRSAAAGFAAKAATLLVAPDRF